MVRKFKGGAANKRSGFSIRRSAKEGMREEKKFGLRPRGFTDSFQWRGVLRLF
jgi:hypothetical protein